MLSFDARGIYCRQAGLYIDPWMPVDKAIITHAHSDHARPGSRRYLCHTDTVPILQLRLGRDLEVEGIPYGQTIYINGVRISLHPAGHITGSAQVRLEYKGEIWVVSGDYKVQDDGVSTPFEVVKCHHFITESTFGLPIYNFPEPKEVHADINSWWAQNTEAGINTVITGYALGKAQRIMQHLDASTGAIYLHGAVDNVNQALGLNKGVFAEARRLLPTDNIKHLRPAMILAPPSAIGTPWMQKLKPYSLGVCSGWMQLRGARRRRGADRGFVLSDHCDWQQLNTAIQATGAGHVYVTHGYKSVFSRWLQEELDLQAFEVDTLYEAGSDELAGSTGED
jgi:putative mRNA 3-end processing factor